MKYDPARHHRRSIRLRGYDYSQAGAYFVTVCVQGREPLFGDVVDGETRLNDAGQMVARCWHELPAHFPHLELDEFVVMPNHMHGIVIVGAPFMAPYGSGAVHPGAVHPGAVNPGAVHPGAVNPGAINRAPTGGDRVPFVGAPFMAPYGSAAVNPGAVNPGAINRAPTGGDRVPYVGAPFMAPYGSAAVHPGAVNPGAVNPGAVNPGAINRAPTGGDRVPYVGAPFMAPYGSGAVNPGAINRAPTGGDRVPYVGAPFMAPYGSGAVNPGAINRAPTLGEIVRSFKAVATRRIRQAGVSAFAWQRNYYEHIIRDEESLNRIREYIRNNPLQWALDRENPHSTGAVRNPPIRKDEPWRI